MFTYQFSIHLCSILMYVVCCAEKGQWGRGGRCRARCSGRPRTERHPDACNYCQRESESESERERERERSQSPGRAPVGLEAAAVAAACAVAAAARGCALSQRCAAAAAARAAFGGHGTAVRRFKVWVEVEAHDLGGLEHGDKLIEVRIFGAILATVPPRPAMQIQ